MSKPCSLQKGGQMLGALFFVAEMEPQSGEQSVRPAYSSSVHVLRSVFSRKSSHQRLTRIKRVRHDAVSVLRSATLLTAGIWRHFYAADLRFCSFITCTARNTHAYWRMSPGPTEWRGHDGSQQKKKEDCSVWSLGEPPSKSINTWITGTRTWITHRALSSPSPPVATFNVIRDKANCSRS